MDEKLSPYSAGAFFVKKKLFQITFFFNVKKTVLT